MPPATIESAGRPVRCACSGCYAAPLGLTGGEQVTYPMELTFKNGTCVNNSPTPPPCKAEKGYEIDGEFNAHNNTEASVWWSDDEGSSTQELPAGTDLVKNNNSKMVICSVEDDQQYRILFYSDSEGNNVIASYTWRCSVCSQ